MVHPVLLDTDVFSKVFVAARRDQVGVTWATALQGRTIAIAAQTEVELRAWPSLRGWGKQRAAELDALIRSVSTVQVDARVQAAYVELTVWAKQAGHGICGRTHTGDRWVASTALAYGLELAAIDGIYEGIDGLTRVTP